MRHVTEVMCSPDPTEEGLKGGLASCGLEWVITG